MAAVWYFISMPSVGYYIFKIIKVCTQCLASIQYVCHFPALVLQVGVHWDAYKEIYEEFDVNGRPADETHFIYIGTTLITLCEGVRLACNGLAIVRGVPQAVLG